MDRMEGSPRRNSSLNIINAAQVYTPVIRVTLQGAPTIGTRLINILESKKPKNI